MEVDEAVSDLVESDEEYQKLHSLHQEHERMLHEFAGKAHLSESEDLEEKRLKKEKLVLKDRMEAIVRRYRESPTA
jgi:uncharacterized protein YdcH (DUF465 family)